MTRVAVGIGRDIQEDELVRITGNSDRTITPSGFDDLKSYLKQLQEISCCEYLGLITRRTQELSLV